MGSWVEDFDALQLAPNTFDLASGVPRKLHSKKEKLEAELKLLQWHKLANEAAIKAALMQTKAIKGNKVEKAPFHTVEDAKWMKKVINQEKTRPLQVSKDFVIKYDKKEKQRSEKLSDHVERHISTLKALRDKIESRKDITERSTAYRAWKKEFNPKKNAILTGKILSEFEDENDLSYQRANENVSNQSEHIDEDIMRFQKMTTDSGLKQSNKELSNVLESLHKLSELETRISSLEKENVYDTLKTMDRAPDQTSLLPGRTSLQFKKQKINLADQRGGTVGVAYSLRTKKTNTWAKPIAKPKPIVIIKNRGTAAIGSSTSGARGGNYNNTSKAKTMPSKGFFLTEYDSSGHALPSKSRSATTGKLDTSALSDAQRQREELRKERLRNMALAPEGQKTLRNRIQAKKMKQREGQLGEQRHEEAMQEIIRRRQEMQQRKPPLTKIYGAKTTKGASSGIRSGNKYMNDVENMRQGFQRKNDDFKLAMDRDKQARLLNGPGTHMSHTTGGISREFGDNNDGRLLLPPIQRRMPMTRTNGTTTRRTEDTPVRRRILGPDYDYSPSSAAVSGIGGLRLLRNMK